MRREQILGFLAVTGVALLVGGAATAQDQTAPVAGSNPSDPGFAGAAGVNLPPQEQLQQADALIKRLDEVRTGVRRQLDAARAQRDVVKMLCLNDKLSQLDVAVRTAKERKQALEVAISRKDTDLANHEFTVLSALNQRADQLSGEAAQCVGAEGGAPGAGTTQGGAAAGESATSSTVDPNLPADPGGASFSDPSLPANGGSKSIGSPSSAGGTTAGGGTAGGTTGGGTTGGDTGATEVPNCVSCFK